MAVFSEASKLHDIRFGTDGWRALIAKEFTYKNLNILLDGLASFILEKHGMDKPLVIGYDARFLADKFANFAAKIINSWGINVKLISHPVPTPVIAHAAKHEGSCGALTFTASHNPPDYMGIKYIPEYAGPATVDITNAILDYVEIVAADPNGHKAKEFSKHNIKKLDGYTEDLQNLKSEARGLVAANGAQTLELDPAPAYIEQLKSIVNFDAIKEANSKKACKLIYDPIYGCGRNYTDKLLREAGFKLEVLHDEKNPSFGGLLPEPSEKVLTELKATVKERAADLGAANDGDADRFAFMDGEGNYYPANKSLPIILKYLIEERGFKGLVARTVATTHLLDEVAHKHSMNVMETAVGFKWLGEIMREQDTILAAEQSGGVSVLGHIPEKDGILAIMLLSEVLAITGKPLSQLWQEVQDFVGKEYYFEELNLHFEGDAKEAFMEKFRDPELKSIGRFKVMNIDTTEGVKLYLENGNWLLARPSGTEAMCRVYFESNSAEELVEITEAVKELVC